VLIISNCNYCVEYPFRAAAWDSFIKWFISLKKETGASRSTKFVKYVKVFLYNENLQ